MKLNWVTLKITNLEKSLHFYTQLLGLSIAAEFRSSDTQFIMLGEADESKVELIYEPGSIVHNPGNGVSIGLEADHLDQLIDELEENGYKTVGPISPNPKIRFFFVNDPDGYTVQLVEQKK
ncbi:MAG: VOC family protein [Peptostreptococcales bacterium]